MYVWTPNGKCVGGYACKDIISQHLLLIFQKHNVSHSYSEIYGNANNINKWQKNVFVSMRFTKFKKEIENHPPSEAYITYMEWGVQ